MFALLTGTCVITIMQINWNFINESKPIHLWTSKNKAYTTNGTRTVYIYTNHISFFGVNKVLYVKIYLEKVYPQLNQYIGIFKFTSKLIQGWIYFFLLLNSSKVRFKILLCQGFSRGNSIKYKKTFLCHLSPTHFHRRELLSNCAVLHFILSKIA